MFCTFCFCCVHLSLEILLATVKDKKGNPIERAKIDVCETDGNGLYDNQYEERDIFDMRGRLTSNNDGEIVFKCVKPISSSAPTDGPVGKLPVKLHRHACRPAHIHFVFMFLKLYMMI
ncbi:unnamed protein product [Rotaria socialis]|uniref:Intradiol ring-cleavage dioxygenases domain-containing protein n=1 Tax=Rotaria socialis TaxID=392032 RepID=A0A818K5U7_9BILA|nr:unnamed protein product [Rotaria socialis]CAF3669517.1 unnamed protein product [Rotaria socialis]CAF4653485.1 unnamed protein product [Rotaria socialis]CAF4943478.1 unnamed protein product [Rotaria socialis]